MAGICATALLGTSRAATEAFIAEKTALQVMCAQLKAEMEERRGGIAVIDLQEKGLFNWKKIGVYNQTDPLLVLLGWVNLTRSGGGQIYKGWEIKYIWVGLPGQHRK